MSKTIEASELPKVVMKYLTEYEEDIEDDVIEIVDQTTKEARDELIKTSPRRQGSRATPYYKGWTIKLSKKQTGQYHKVIWNKTNYQLTHLLEFGHLTRNGQTRTRAIPHIRPVEEKYNVEFVDKLEQKIRRSSQ